MSGLRGRVYAIGTIKIIRTVDTYTHSYLELVQAPAPSANPPGKVFDNTTPAPSITPTSPTSATNGYTSVLITGTGFLAGAGTVDVVVSGAERVRLRKRFSYTVTRSFEETIV